MSYQVSINPKTGDTELVVSGWQNGLADSPYTGIARMQNLCPWYYPGAVYPNYTRINGTSGSPTIAQPLYITTSDPNGYTGEALRFVIDASGNMVGQTSGGGSFVAITPGNAPLTTAVTGLCFFAPTQQGNGIVSNKSYIFAWGNGGANMYYLAAPFTGGGANNWTNFGSYTQQGAGTNYAIWSSFSNGMYFCNGNFVGSMLKGSSDFNPGGSASTDYVFQNGAVVLPYYETAVWLGELGTNLLIAAGNRIYLWPFTGANPTSFIQFPEPVYKFIVINNLIYAFCGDKGNIYVSNSYSISLFKKVPDSFFTVGNTTSGYVQTDPQISWGGIMYHRNMLYFGASSNTQTAALGYISGVFSLNLSTAVLNFENQSSYGLYGTIPTGGNGQPIFLMDNQASQTDSYFSAYFNNSVGGIDKSSTTFYSSGETIIETDLIPIGRFLNPTTPLNVEFKLDAPMSANDSIQILGRGSLSSPYISFGTYTFVSNDTNNSFAFTSTPLQNLQWLQLQVIVTASSGNPFRLYELRIRSNEPLQITI